MFEPFAVQQILSGGKDLIEALAAIVQLVKSGLGAKDKLALSKALVNLKALYFYDDQARTVMKNAANGQVVTSEQIDRAWHGLEMSRSEVSEALDALDRYAETKYASIPIEAYNKLRGLRYGKGDVRFDIFQFMARLEQPYEGDDERRMRAEAAQKILDKIDEVNSSLALLDSALRGI